VIKRMVKVARHDWKHSHRLDLTDKDVLAELKRHKIDAESEMAIGARRRKSKQTLQIRSPRQSGAECTPPMESRTFRNTSDMSCGAPS